MFEIIYLIDSENLTIALLHLFELPQKVPSKKNIIKTQIQNQPTKPYYTECFSERTRTPKMDHLLIIVVLDQILQH